MIIDSHIHAGHGTALRNSWDTFEDIDVSLRRMDEMGIGRAVVFPINHDDYATANRELSRIVAGHPGRLAGYAKVNQEKDAGSIARMLAEGFGKLGLKGLKLHGLPNREVMEAMKEHRRPILVDPFGEVLPLRRVAEQYPDATIIVAHMGKFLCGDGLATIQTLWLAKAFPNVYFDTSSVVLHEWLERAVQEGLCGKMIFGSDGPVLHCGVELSRIRMLKLTAEDESRVLGGTILRLLGANAWA